MTRDQVLPALFAALVEEGVDPGLVERAVGRVLDIPPGASVTGGSPLLRAFAFEQARRLEGDGHGHHDAEALTQRLVSLHTGGSTGWRKPTADASARPAGMPPRHPGEVRVAFEAAAGLTGAKQDQEDG